MRPTIPRARQVSFSLLITLSLALAAGPGANAQGMASRSAGDALASRLHWESLDGPPGGNTILLEQDSVRPEHLYLSTLRGLYRSADQGDSWQLLDPALTTEVISLAFSDAGAFGCGARGLLLIADGSDQAKLMGEPCYRVAAAGSLLFAAQGSEQLGRPAVRLRRLDLAAADPRWVDVTPPAESWQELAAQVGPDRSFLGIEDLMATPQRTFASVALSQGPMAFDRAVTRLFTSDDDGLTWSVVDTGLPRRIPLQRLVHDPGSGTLIALGHINRLDGPFLPISKLARISRDGGHTWRPLTRIEDIAAPTISDADIVGEHAVLTNVDFSILELSGHGKVLERRPMPRVKGYSISFPLDELIFDSTDRDTIYGRGYLGWEGIIRSRDGGRTWQRLAGGIVASAAPNLATHPSDPETIVAAGNLGYLPHITRDGGDTWQPLVGTANMADEVAFDPADPDHLLLVSELTDILESRDGGDSWRPIARQFSADRVHDLAISPDGDRLYASNLGSNVSWLGGLRPDDDVPLGEGENLWHNMLWSPDYAYALEATPDGALFASYSPRKFESHAAVWRHDPDGAGEREGWSEVLRVEAAGGITDLAVGPGDPWRLYAGVVGERAAVWVSEDRGASWRPTHDEAFDFVTVHAVAIDPADPDVVYAAPWGAGLFRSDDAGQSWSRLPSPTVSVASIVLDEGDPGHILIGDRTRPVLWESTDGARTWHSRVEFDPEKHYRVMAMAALHDGLYLSLLDRTDAGLGVFAGRLDSGSTYRLDDDGPHLIEGMPTSALAFADTADAVYAVGHIKGVYRIVGDRAEDISAGLPDMGFLDLLIDAGQLLVAGGADVDLRLAPRVGDPSVTHNIYRRLGPGRWQALLHGDPFGSPIKRLRASGERDGQLLAATGSGIYISADRGATWQAQSDGLGARAIGALAVSGDRLVAGTLGGGVSVGTLSPGGEVSWRPSGGPRPPIANVRLLADPSDPARLWASAYPGGVFRSLDGGRTWLESNFGLPSFEVADPLLQGYYSLSLDPARADTLYLAISGHGVFRSTDGAATWLPLGRYGSDRALMSSALTQLLVDPEHPQRLWLSSADRGVFTSPDRGRTWHARNKGLGTREVLTLELSRDGTLVAGTAGYGVYVLPRGHTSWQHLGRPVGTGEWKAWNRRLYQYSALLFDPRDQGRVLLGHFPGGFYRSDDGGHTWRSSNLGIGNDGLFSLAVHPERPDVIFAGSYNGILRSDDGGQTWRDSSSGMPPEQWPFTVVIDDRAPELMYTATKNGHDQGFCDRNRDTFCGTVMRSADGGATWQPIMEGLDQLAEYYMIELDPRDHDVLYLSSSRGIFVSADRGDHWSQANEGLPVSEFFVRDNVAQNLKLTADGRHLVLGVVGYGVWRAALPELAPAE